MGYNKLDALMWEYNIFEHEWSLCDKAITQENLNSIPFEDVNKFRVFRDNDYNINISCIIELTQFNQNKYNKEKTINNNELLIGSTIPEGKLKINLCEDYSVVFESCYVVKNTKTINKKEYIITCRHIEGKDSSKSFTVLKEWLLNGDSSGLNYCSNKIFNFEVEEATFGSYGDMEFPIKQLNPVRECQGSYINIKYKDTAFDIHFVGKSYGPQWSNNLSISYFEKYGRIPSLEERKIIRNYLSFFIGKRLIYIGNSTFDENGNQIGFVMETPHSYGFDIKKICFNAAKTPIETNYDFFPNYFDVVQKYLEPFEAIYDKLDFESLLNSYWYADSLVKPMDLPILASALEHLMKKWYESIEMNPETLLMNKKDFAKYIQPIKELVTTQFKDTNFAKRMTRSIYNMNKMSINEQMHHFFEKIGMPLGEEEQKALQARNISVHGDYEKKNPNCDEIFKVSQIYECIINRVILKLLNYSGKYIDYGTIGYPEKDINCPSGQPKIE